MNIDELLQELKKEYLKAERMRLKCVKNGDVKAAIYWEGLRSGVSYAMVLITDQPVWEIMKGESDSE